ncbi:MAG: aminodeoxychorismate synthase component I [Gemmatimonadota bacterium]
MATPGSVRIDFRAAGPAWSQLHFAAPVRVLEARALTEVRPVLRAAAAAAAEGAWVAGFVAYEAAPAFEPVMGAHPSGPLPLAWFAVYGAPEPEPQGRGRVVGPARLGLDWRPGVDAARHATDVARVRAAIAAGEVYQVNYTFPLTARFDTDVDTLWNRLAAAQVDGYFALLDTGPHAILSASPELFFRTSGRRITTRPMKGTRPRGRWPAEDREAAAALADSAKDRAENLMIVDLLRNDLGRVARTGTVCVPALFQVERYPTVWQMTSTIEAELRADVGLEEVFAALFPCGSVTGAPKIAATRFIADLEDTPRGAYCGAVGLLRPGGDAVFNVAIRTAVVDRPAATVTYGVGGGITSDSDAAAEHGEALAKAAVLSRPPRAFELLETLRLEHGAYGRLERHLARMAEGAEHFGFPFRSDDARANLEAHAALHGNAARRVRLLSAPDGRLRVESAALAEPWRGSPAGAEELRPTPLAASRVDRLDPLLQHKTTWRRIYDEALAEHPDAFDVLLLNREDEVTEFTRGNLVVRLDGVYLTPPRDCGLLPGCYRAELVETGMVEESVLRAAELARADGVWLVNSVRGWVPVAPVNRP